MDDTGKYILAAFLTYMKLVEGKAEEQTEKRFVDNLKKIDLLLAKSKEEPIDKRLGWS